MIASVAFRNFKALRDASVQLAPFNLVLGPAGSGKTSLIEALLCLRTFAHAPSQLRNTEFPDRDALEMRFRFSAPHEAIEIRLADDILHLSPANPPDWPALRSDLTRIRAYEFDPDAMAVPSLPAAGAALEPDGANLAAVLAAMRDEAPEAFAALSMEMLRIFPEYSRLELQPRPDGAVAIALAVESEGTLVTGDALSQGTLHTLAVLALAFAPSPPSAVCIEEIDRGVHPRMLREIRDALYRLSHPAASGLTRAPVQVIATTHSPYMLDLFREHPEEIIITQKRGAAAHFERLSDRSDLPQLLQEGSLGDLWFSGILGGVPGAE